MRNIMIFFNLLLTSCMMCFVSLELVLINKFLRRSLSSSSTNCIVDTGLSFAVCLEQLCVARRNITTIETRSPLY